MNISVLFVCLGNICRSPMAETLFIDLVDRAGLTEQISVDSCGTSGWHIGEPADARMRATAEKNGLTIRSRSRQIREEDFEDFDYIIAMDGSNLRELQRIAIWKPEAKAQLFKMRQFDARARGADVPDPYYGGDGGFDRVFDLLQRSCAALLAHIRQEKGI